MKQILFTILLALFSVSVVNTQTSETISQLTPVPKNIGKFSKRLPKVDSYSEPSDIEFSVETETINLPHGKPGINVTVQTTYRELAFENIGGKETTRINIYGRITSKDKTRDGFFEERLSVTADIDDLIKGVDKPIILRKVFELPEGNYQIGVIIRDIASGGRGVKVVKFQIPQSVKVQKL